MKTRSMQMTATAAVVLLACACPVEAHHSRGMFDVSSPIWVKGTVISYEPVAPHAMILLEEMTADGRTQLWNIEGPFPGRLNRILSANGLSEGNAFFKPGDLIEVCGFDLREEQRSRRPPPDATEPAPKFAHGHVIVMPDGHRQSWGAYGKINNCVRASDRPEEWREFLDTDALAREFWCGGQRSETDIQITPEAFVREVDGLIRDSCD